MTLAGTVKTKLTSLAARMVRVHPARLAGKRPVASITFDDFPQNAWQVGGPILARHGVRATYYTAGGFCGRTVEGTRFFGAHDLEALAAAGHEIGCHGFGHQPTPALPDGDLMQDWARNQEFLRRFTGGAEPVSYAYPHGRASLRTKRFLAPRFASLRGVHQGVNRGDVDLAQLEVMSLETRCWKPARLEAAIRRTVSDRGWLIFYTHDVSDTPSRYGSTPAMLDWALARLAAAGIEVLPVREALAAALDR